MVDRVAVIHSAPSGRAGRHWGDTHFAESLTMALARSGVSSEVVARDQRDSVDAGCPVVVIRGMSGHLPSPGVPSVLWVINRSDEVTDEELDAFDHVAVASSIEATRFRQRTDTPVHVLHQATDSRRFRPLGVGATPVADGVIVVANNRWPGRRAPRWLRLLGVDYRLYGLKWGGTPEARHVVAQHVPNEHLAGLYATAELVVADQWVQMSRAGFVANRLFDVAAAGGFVLSDAGPGIAEVFGELLPTFGTCGELGAQLDRWRGDPEARRARGRELRALVLEDHTFDQRAGQLLAWLG